MPLQSDQLEKTLGFPISFYTFKETVRLGATALLYELKRAKLTKVSDRWTASLLARSADA